LAKPPPGTAERPKPLNQQALPDLGRAPESKGLLVPWELVAPLVQTSIGEVRAQMERELSDRLGGLDNKIEGLKADLGRKPGWGGVWALAGIIVTTALTMLALVFAFLMNGSDRSESGMAIGMEVGKAIQQQAPSLRRAPEPSDEKSVDAS
jgi:hypothetical protein